MSRFSIFTAPAFAIFSSEFYRDVGRHWRFKTFVYLLLLELVCWIPGILTASAAFNAFVADEGDALTKQIPPISIKDGVATAQVEQPHYIRTKNPPQVVAIIDTTGKIKSLEGTTAKVLLTKTELIVEKNGNQTQHHSLRSADELAFDGPMIRGWLDTAAAWGPLVFYPVMVLFAFGCRIAQAILYSLIGLVIANLMGVRIGYGGVLSVTLASLTAPILLRTLFEVTGIKFPFSDLAGITIAIAYLTIGLIANRGDDEELTLVEDDA